MADTEGLSETLDACEQVRERVRVFGRLLVDVMDTPDAVSNQPLEASLDNLTLNRYELEPWLLRMAAHPDTRAPPVDKIFIVLRELYAKYANCVQQDTDLQREMWDVKRFCGKIRESGMKLAYKPVRDNGLANSWC